MLVSSLSPFLSSLSRQSLSGRLIRSFSGIPKLWVDKNSTVLGQYIVNSEKTFYVYDHKSTEKPSRPSQKPLTFEDAVKELKPSATVIDGYLNSSAPIIDSIKAEIPLVVCTAEVDDADFEGIKWHLKHSRKTRLIGPNSFGVFRPFESHLGSIECVNQKGKIGIAARGRMVYPSLIAVKPANLGYSFIMDIGTAEFNGTTFVDACNLLFEDEATEGVLLSGYLGHSAEQELLEWLAAKRRTNKTVVILLHHPSSIPLDDHTKQLLHNLAQHEVRVVFHTPGSSCFTAIANHFENI